MNNIISTKVNFVRNLKEYKFVPKLENDKKQEIIEKLSTALNKKLSLLNLENTISNSNIKSNSQNKDLNATIENLLESNLINHEFLAKDYKIIFLSDMSNIILTCFENEHVNIKSTSIGYDLKGCFKQAFSLANLLKDKLALAYSDEYGYLMSDLTRIGTGLRIECEISLPSIKALDKIAQIQKNLSNSGYNLVEKATFSPDFNGKGTNEFIVSTTCNLGFTESEICSEFDKMITKLQELELESTKMIDEGSHDELLDKTLRSIAIINNAYLMSNSELREHLTNIRTGLNLDLITGINIEKINQIQRLITNKDENFTSRSSLIELAYRTSQILKGGN